MVVAVTSVEMVQVTIHEVIDMISVGYCLVSAIPAVNVSFSMSRTVVFRRALVGVRVSYFDPVIVYVITVPIMQMAIVKKICMPIVLHGRMPAIRAVHVRVST
jgi:hypothetical protein